MFLRYSIIPGDRGSAQNVKSTYKKNKLNELGKKVLDDFEYDSGTNKKILNQSQIKNILKKLSY